MGDGVKSVGVKVDDTVCLELAFHTVGLAILPSVAGLCMGETPTVWVT